MEKKSVRIATGAALIAAAFAMAIPAHAQTALQSDPRLGTQLPVETSASAGSSVIAAPSTAGVKTALVYDGDGPDSMNVNYGDTYLFTIRHPMYRDRYIKWRFNGSAPTIHFNEIDPTAQFARNVTIHVNR